MTPGPGGPGLEWRGTMPEITLRDLCRWDRRLELIPPAGESRDDAAGRGVSWAVTVRTSPPLLPPLRGDELIVLSRRVLEHIEETQLVTREQLLDMLRDQRISAVLTEPSFTESPLEALPVVTMPAPFPPDAEGTLNRLLTERRAELYRLGNELSRRLSQATMDPRGVEGILDAAAEIGNRSIILQHADGGVIAASGRDTPRPASSDEIRQASEAGSESVAITGEDLERLIVRVPSTPEQAFLSISAAPGTLTEVDRLTLEQTAGTAAIVMAKSLPANPRSAREESVAELVEGRLGSDDAMIARARVLGIEPGRTFYVCALERRTVDDRDRTTERLIGGFRDADAAAVGDITAYLVSEPDYVEFQRRLQHLTGAANEHPVSAAISEPVRGVTGAPEALRQARYALGLIKGGVLDGPVVRCESLEDIGVYGLLYQLAGTPAMAEFRTRVLGELEAYDQRRGTELVETLRAYLSTGGSLSEAAANLSVHRNTLSYRINRIAALSGWDLNRPDHRMLLNMALLCRDIMQVHG